MDTYMLCKFIIWILAKLRILTASGRQRGERIGGELGPSSQISLFLNPRLSFWLTFAYLGRSGPYVYKMCAVSLTVPVRSSIQPCRTK